MLLAVCLPGVVSAADKKAERQAERQAAKEARQALNQTRVLRLEQMSPEERDAALAKLPPEQRARIEQRLETFSKRPAAQQERIIDQQKRLMALPPEKRQEARQALSDLVNTQPPRRGVIAAQLRKLSTMSDEDRAQYMNSARFRAQFSEQEIQLMNNLRGIVP
jgi:hypothetical protein